MQTVLFLDKEVPVKASVKRLTEHTIQITGVGVNLSGFRLYNKYGIMFGKFDDYTTLYKSIEDGFIVSNDGSVYTEPDVLPPVEPEEIPVYVPTLEEVQEEKVAEMKNIQHKVIEEGVDVTLTDGTVEHFTLSAQDQMNLNALQTQVMAGVELIPWHPSDESVHCKNYTNKDMAIITSTALAYVAYHVTYFRDLRIFIRSLETKEEVKEVTYGMAIPEEYQSEPLKEMLAQLA